MRLTTLTLLTVVGVLTEAAGQSCGTTLYDFGGPNGDYAGGQTVNTGACPDDAGDAVTFTFTAFELGAGDSLIVYDGVNPGAPRIGAFGGTDLPNLITATNATGCLATEFISDDAEEGPGYAIDVTCSPLLDCPPPQNVIVTPLSHLSVNVAAYIPPNAAAIPVEVYSEGADPATAAPLLAGTVGGFPFRIFGIAPSTTYDLYVGSDCTASSDGVSALAGPVAFTTPDAPSCGDRFVDSGGPDQGYFNNERTVTTICPDDPATLITATFLEFDLEEDFDFLTVYDGDSTNAPVIGDLTGTDLPQPITADNPSGCLTFFFAADEIESGDGWVIDITCAPPPACPGAPAPTSAIPGADFVELSLPGFTAGDVFEVSAFLAGDDPNTATPIAQAGATTPTVTLTGLVPSTAYAAYTRRDCSAAGDGLSAFSVATPFTTQATLLGCGTQFYDSGGPDGNYQNNEDVTTRICPDAVGEVVFAAATSFDLESGFDFLTVYDGENTQAPLIASLTGSARPPLLVASGPSGCLTFRFESDGSFTRSGWAFDITCDTFPACLTTSAPALTFTRDLSVELTLPDFEAGDVYEVSVYRAGDDPTASTPVSTLSADADVVTLDGLSPLTDYEAYARRDCRDSDDGLSPFSPPTAFRTQAPALTCGDAYFDTGGPDGDYGPDEEITTTICPDVAGETVTLTFDTIRIDGFDALEIREGDDPRTFTTLTVRDDYSSLTITSSHPSGCLTTTFRSSSIIEDAGWVASVSCAPAPDCPAVVDASVREVRLTNVLLRVITPQSSSAYEIGAFAAGADPDADAPLVTQTEFFSLLPTLEGLTEGTSYDIYLRTDCSSAGNGSGVWFGPLSVTTLNIPLVTCGEVFTDIGGPDGVYASRLDYTTTICPNSVDEQVAVTFTALDLEAGFDFLYVFDGDNTDAPVLDTLSSRVLPNAPYVSTARSGCLTFRFTSDGSVQFDGWQADVTCERRARVAATASGCADEITAVVDGSGTPAEVHFRDPGGAFVATIANTQDLGEVSVRLYDTDAARALGSAGTSFDLGRNVAIRPERSPSAPVTLTLYAPVAEVDAVIAADAQVAAASDLQFVRVNAGECAPAYNGFGSPVALTASQVDDYYSLRSDVAEFGEFFVAPNAFSLSTAGPATGAPWLTLAPNPTGNSAVTVEVASELVGERSTLTVTNANGQAVMRRGVRTSSTLLDLSAVAPGAYGVTVVSPAGTITQRLVVQ